MSLNKAVSQKEYIIKKINIDDEALNTFLFSIGLYAGEPITIINHTHSGCIIAIKDARYSIDHQLAAAIIV